MKKLWYIPPIALLVFGIFMVCGGGVEDNRYQGTEVFNSEQDYIKFKEAIVDNEAKIIKAEVLSSTPPIIVSYDIKAKDFPYGEEQKDGIYFGAMLIIFSIVLWLGIRKEIKVLEAK